MIFRCLQQITVDTRLFESCTRRVRYCLRKLYEQSAQDLNQDTYQSFKQTCEVAIAFLGSFKPSQSIQQEYSKTHSLIYDSLVKIAKSVINDNKAAIQSKGQSEEQKRAQMNAYVELVSSTPLANQKRLFIKMAIEDAVNFNKDNASLDAAEFFGMVRDISKLMAVIGTDSFEIIAQQYCTNIASRLRKSFMDLSRSTDVGSYQSFMDNFQAAIEFLLISRATPSVEAKAIIETFNKFVSEENIHRRFHDSIKRVFSGHAKNMAMRTLESLSMASQDLCILYKGKNVRQIDLILNLCARTVQEAELRDQDIERKNPKEIRWIKKFDQAILYQESQHQSRNPLPPILQSLCAAAQIVLRQETVPTLSKPQQMMTEKFEIGCRAFNETVDALTKSKLEVLSEHLLECGIRLDIVVRTQDRKLAYLVEIDGPQHYDASNRLRLRDEFTFAAAAQELVKLGYTVNIIRIKSADVTSININGESIDKNIMSSYPQKTQKPRESVAPIPSAEKAPQQDPLAPGTLAGSMLKAKMSKTETILPSDTVASSSDATSTNPSAKH